MAYHIRWESLQPIIIPQFNPYSFVPVIAGLVATLAHEFDLKMPSSCVVSMILILILNMPGVDLHLFFQ